MLAAHPYSTQYHCRTLHSKLYLLECDSLVYALLGSPNLTDAAARKNRELAVEFRDLQPMCGPVGEFLVSIREYIQDLVSQDDVTFVDNDHRT
jgi:phosphatidylserine/phosphatidylglycerophosphate/cardiolipin synthase-like enzyme